jgi:hypothetical protein
MQPEESKKITITTSGAHDVLEKPFIPHAPGSLEKDILDPESPNPESNPNYSYMPAIAYPDGILEYDQEQDGE